MCEREKGVYCLVSFLFVSDPKEPSLCGVHLVVYGGVTMVPPFGTDRKVVTGRTSDLFLDSTSPHLSRITTFQFLLVHGSTTHPIEALVKY